MQGKRAATLLALVSVSALLPAPAIAQAPTYITQWGSLGSGNGQFFEPRGMAVDADGSVYVADWNNGRIQKFTATGTYLTQWGSRGSGDGQFYFGPCGIEVDGRGHVYASSFGCCGAGPSDDRLQEFSSTGMFLSRWGSLGSGDGQFFEPLGVAVDASGDVYVADLSNKRIQKFTATGTYVMQWGSRGSGIGQFQGGPWGLATDAAGNVYASDTSTCRVLKFSSTGTFLTQWGSFGDGEGQFRSPHGVAVDPNGYVYVTDTLGHRVQQFTGDGVYIAQWGTFGSGNGQFSHPYDVATDAEGSVYVTDTVNNRIQKFGFLPIPTKATSWGRLKRMYR
jgi:tripartite motif-containing protein 71